MTAAAGTGDEAAWLRLGRPSRAAERIPAAAQERLRLAGPDAGQVALEAGVTAPAGSPLEDRLIRSVLDGLASESASPAPGPAGDLLRLLAPRYFLLRAKGFDTIYVLDVGHVGLADEIERTEPLEAVRARLQARFDGFGELGSALRTGGGPAPTTSFWADTARALSVMAGPCWLAAEIAIIGAAAPEEMWPTGSAPPGDEPDYGRLVRDVRVNRRAAAWWAGFHDAYADDLSKGTWALALLAVAGERVIRENLGRLEGVVQSIPERTLTALLLSSSRIAASGLSRRLSIRLLPEVAPMSPATALLISHHVGPLDLPASLAPLGTETLAQMGRYGIAAWPATRALAARAVAEPSAGLVAQLGRLGARVSAGVDVSGLSPGLLRLIVDEPARYPLLWLLAAELRLSRLADEPSLAVVAESGHWFGGSG
jgi:hypothetical protein